MRELLHLLETPQNEKVPSKLLKTPQNIVTLGKSSSNILRFTFTYSLDY